MATKEEAQLSARKTLERSGSGRYAKGVNDPDSEAFDGIDRSMLGTQNVDDLELGDDGEELIIAGNNNNETDENEDNNEYGNEKNSQAAEEEDNQPQKPMFYDPNTRPYQDPLVQPIAKVGNIQIGLSHAKLYGLNVDETTGTVILDEGEEEERQRQQQRQERMMALSKKPELDPDSITYKDEIHSFRPERSSAAKQALSKCKYDFIDDLAKKGDLVTRMNEDMLKQKAMSKAELRNLEADYAARLDKLQCPNCKKPQSFTQFMDKDRFCGQCPGKPRFEKLNISSGANFAKKLQEEEAERQRRLEKLHNDVYGNVGKMKVNTSAIKLTKPRVSLMESISGSKQQSVSDGESNNNQSANENTTKKVSSSSTGKSSNKLPPVGPSGASVGSAGSQQQLSKEDTMAKFRSVVNNRYQQNDDAFQKLAKINLVNNAGIQAMATEAEILNNQSNTTNRKQRN